MKQLAIAAWTLLLALLLAYAAHAAPSTVALTATIWNLDYTLASNARLILHHQYTQNLSVIDAPYLKTLITNNSGAIPTTNFLQGEYLLVQIDASPTQQVLMPASGTVDLSALLGSPITFVNSQIAATTAIDLAVSGQPVTLSTLLTAIGISGSLDMQVTGSPVTVSGSLGSINLALPLDWTVSGSPILIVQQSGVPVPIGLTGTFYNGGSPAANTPVYFVNRFVQVIGTGVIRQSARTLYTNSQGVMPLTNFIQGEQVRIKVGNGPAKDITLPYTSTLDLSSIL